MGLTAHSRERKQKSERICIEKRSDRNRPPQIIRGVPAPVVADRAVRADRWRRRSRFPCRAVRRVTLAITGNDPRDPVYIKIYGIGGRI